MMHNSKSTFKGRFDSFLFQPCGVIKSVQENTGKKLKEMTYTSTQQSR